MAIIHTAGTGAQFTLYLKEMSIHGMQRKEALVYCTLIHSHQNSRTLGKARRTEGTLGRTLTLSFGNLCSTSLFSSSNLLFPGNLPE